jgi:hypothetical protein
MGGEDWGSIVLTVVLAALPYAVSYIFGRSGRRKDEADTVARYVEALGKREDEIDELRAENTALRKQLKEARQSATDVG